MNLTQEIANQLYTAIERLGATPDLLAIIGSYGDSLTDEEILECLVTYNGTGKAFLSPDDRTLQ